MKRMVYVFLFFFLLMSSCGKKRTVEPIDDFEEEVIKEEKTVSNDSLSVEQKVFTE